MAIYVVIRADQVQPGDLYKFVSTEHCYYFADVLQVAGDLVRVRFWDRRLGEKWVHKRPHAGHAIFGRKAETI